MHELRVAVRKRALAIIYPCSLEVSLFLQPALVLTSNITSWLRLPLILKPRVQGKKCNTELKTLPRSTTTHMRRLTRGGSYLESRQCNNIPRQATRIRIPTGMRALTTAMCSITWLRLSHPPCLQRQVVVFRATTAVYLMLHV